MGPKQRELCGQAEKSDREIERGVTEVRGEKLQRLTFGPSKQKNVNNYGLFAVFMLVINLFVYLCVI